MLRKSKEKKSPTGKDAAYRDWVNRLSWNEMLPRGKYFEGKRGRKPRYELYQYQKVVLDNLKQRQGIPTEGWRDKDTLNPSAP